MINATFAQFLTSNQRIDTTFEKLAEVLGIDDYGDPSDDTRADLVFLLGNSSLRRLVIVELKAPNTPLDGTHLRQLQDYMRKAKRWLSEKGFADCHVEGFLIGSMADPLSRPKEVEWLRGQMEETQNRGDWRVYDILEVLGLSERAHQELLDAYHELQKVKKA